MHIETVRHSLAHIMAYAIQVIYPGTKFGIGPTIENGFYYDFELPESLTPEDLPKIEKKMKEIIKKNITFKKKIISKKEVQKLFKNQPYKLELIKELPGKNVTIYETCLPAGRASFVDLCKGPHIKSTKEIPIDAFKLTKIAGAYWKGNEKNSMLTRIYGTAFLSKRELEAHLSKEQEAEKRDHRLLGQKLELFKIDETVGAGLPLWMPKGAVLRKIIENYLYQELILQGYEFLVTPHIGKLELWKTSGHWELFRENLYSPIDIEEEKYLLKPMNCPFHVKIYQSKIRSYKELPKKYAEFGTVYRYERSGTLHGLVRVRGFTQDDAHIWCTPEQLSTEITKLLRHGLKILKTFGFKNFSIYLSTRPEKYAGTLKDWEKATNVLKYVLKTIKLKYQIDPGGGVFYGPKIDIKIKDTLGRPWQCTTIQVDFNLPERFNITYINKKGTKEKPFMIHRTLIGSLERFIGVLLEHYAGALPLWLAPEQIWIIPVGSGHKKYAEGVRNELKKNNLRIEIKDSNETISKKIREGELQRIPYLLVVGDKEIKTKLVTRARRSRAKGEEETLVSLVRARKRGKGDIGAMELSKFIETIKKEIGGKK